jgi:hypothetical protein
MQWCCLREGASRQTASAGSSIQNGLFMNDYYPFLVEKVSKLEKISESRREIYKGARRYEQYRCSGAQ